MRGKVSASKINIKNVIEDEKIFVPSNGIEIANLIIET